MVVANGSCVPQEPAIISSQLRLPPTILCMAGRSALLAQSLRLSTEALAGKRRPVTPLPIFSPWPLLAQRLESQWAQEALFWLQTMVVLNGSSRVELETLSLRA